MMKIKQIPNFTNYNKEITEKTHICLHTTASRNTMGAINYWKTRIGGKGTVSTPYIIDPSGTLVQLFSPQYWSSHSGSEARDKHTIGIEIANAGECYMNDKNELWNGLDNSVRVTDFISYIDENGLQHYHEAFTEKQVKTIKEIINMLCNIYRIKPTFAPEGKLDNIDDSFGVFTHRQVSSTKTDIPRWVLEWYGIV